jgi:hypothetical protein
LGTLGAYSLLGFSRWSEARSFEELCGGGLEGSGELYDRVETDVGLLARLRVGAAVETGVGGEGLLGVALLAMSGAHGIAERVGCGRFSSGHAYTLWTACARSAIGRPSAVANVGRHARLSRLGRARCARGR